MNRYGMLMVMMVLGIITPGMKGQEVSSCTAGCRMAGCFESMTSSQNSRINLTKMESSCCLSWDLSSADVSGQNSRKAVVIPAESRRKEEGEMAIIYSTRGGDVRMQKVGF